MKSVKAQFISDPEEDENARGQTDSQSKYINEAVEPVLFYEPYGNQYIIPEHGYLPLLHIQVSCQE